MIYDHHFLEKGGAQDYKQVARYSIGKMTSLHLFDQWSKAHGKGSSSLDTTKVFSDSKSFEPLGCTEKETRA